MQPDYAHLLRQDPAQDEPAFYIGGFVRDLASLGAIAAFVAVLCLTLESIT